ncbi:MAG TPA: oligosaccharide flippase family protein [Candidatus Kapabacteria bacterium]|nr:oligosaccharide flippase family protein [Candidatus Kapabacteria bacterium]
MTTRAQHAIKGVAWNYLGRISEFGLLYVIRAIIARTLGPSNDSIFALFSSLTAGAVLLTALGTDWVVYKYLPQLTAQEKPSEAAYLLRKTFFLRLLSSSLGAIAIYTLLGPLHIEFLSKYSLLFPYLIFIALYIVGQNMALFGTATLTASLRTKEVFFINVTTKFLLAAGIAVLVFSSLLTPSTAIIAVTCTACVAGALYIIRISPKLRTQRTPFRLSPLVSFAAFLLGNDLLSIVLGRQSDILVLSYWFPGSPQTSFYDNAFQFGLVVEQGITIGLAGILFSIFSELATRDRARLGEAHRQILGAIQLLFIPVGAFIAFAAPVIIPTIYGGKFLPAIPFVRAFLLLDIIDSGILGGGLNITLLQTINRERTTFTNRCVWGAVNLAVNLYLIPRYGALAALVTTRICDLGAVSVEHFIVRRETQASFPFRHFIIAALGTGIGLAGIFFLPGDSFFNCILAGIVFVLLVAGAYYVTKPPALLWVLQTVRGKLTGTR